MADTKNTGLGELAAVPADDDLLYMVDISDTSMAPTGTSKKNKAKYVLRTNGTANTLGANIAANNYNLAGAGTVLIGGTAPLAGVAGAPNLQVERAGNGAIMLTRTTADSGGPTTEFVKRRSAWDVVSDGDRLGSLIWSAADGVDAANAAQIYAEVDGTPGSNDMPGRLIFATAADGTAVVTERMRITNAGLVGIGTVPTSYKLDVNGSFQCVQMGETWINVTYNTGWGSLGSGYQACQYKRFGDLVILRGVAVQSSGSATLMFTLPSGYRPPARLIHTGASAGAFSRIDIDTNGDVTMEVGSAIWWVSVSGIIFSTVA